MTFYGIVEGGQMMLEATGAFADHVRSLDGKPFELTLQRERRRRDPLQNYYWGVVLKRFAAGLKCSPKELHEVLKHRFLLRDGRVLAGVDPAFRSPAIIRIPQSTASLSTGALLTYVDQVRRLAAQMGVSIPDPERRLTGTAA